MLEIGLEINIYKEEGTYRIKLRLSKFAGSAFVTAPTSFFLEKNSKGKLKQVLIRDYIWSQGRP